MQQKRAVAANRLAPARWPERGWRVRETNESLRDRRQSLRFVLGQSFLRGVKGVVLQDELLYDSPRVEWSRRGAHDDGG